MAGGRERVHCALTCNSISVWRRRETVAAMMTTENVFRVCCTWNIFRINETTPKDGTRVFIIVVRTRIIKIKKKCYVYAPKYTRWPGYWRCCSLSRRALPADVVSVNNSINSTVYVCVCVSVCFIIFYFFYRVLLRTYIICVHVIFFCFFTGETIRGKRRPEDVPSSSSSFGTGLARGLITIKRNEALYTHTHMYIRMRTRMTEIKATRTIFMRPINNASVNGQNSISYCFLFFIL